VLLIAVRSLFRRRDRTHEIPDPSFEEVVEIFRAALHAEVTTSSDFTVGCDHWVKLVDTSTSSGRTASFVLKIPKREKNKLSAEIDSTRTAFQLQIPVPEVVFCDYEKSILVESRLPGVNLASITHVLRHSWGSELADSKTVVEKTFFSMLHSIYHEMGKHLRMLHTRQAPRGHFREYSSDVSLSTNRVFANALDYRQHNRWSSPNELCSTLLERKVVNEQEAKLLLRWYNKYSPALATIEIPVLCHGDYDDSNVIVGVELVYKPGRAPKRKEALSNLECVDHISGSGTVAGIVDWGDSCWGPGAEDLACMYIKHHETWAWDRFLQGYGAVNMDAVRAYAFLRLLWTTDATDLPNESNIRLLRQFMHEIASN